ncbi:MAG: methyltransferase [Akkermansiaceae bacterium]
MDWNERYNNNDMPWEKGEATPVLAELLKIVPQYFQPNTNALVPGCGLGHDVALLHESGIEATGLDISETALKLARQAHPELGDIWLLDDLFQMSSKTRDYDLIWEHTCYCAIPPEKRADYANSIYDLLKPNAYFAGVFFTDTGQPPEIGPPFSTTRTEVFDNFDRKFHLVWEGKPSKSYPGRENREWVMIWRKPIKGSVSG